MKGFCFLIVNLLFEIKINNFIKNENVSISSEEFPQKAFFKIIICNLINITK